MLYADVSSDPPGNARAARDWRVSAIGSTACLQIRPGFRRRCKLQQRIENAAHGRRLSYPKQILTDRADTDSLLQKCRFGRLRQSRSEEHTSELQSLMRTSYAVFCLKKTK